MSKRMRWTCFAMWVLSYATMCMINWRQRVLLNQCSKLMIEQSQMIDELSTHNEFLHRYIHFKSRYEEPNVY